MQSDNSDANQEYAGFWVRVGAFIVDSILFALIIFPLGFFIYGEKYLELDGPRYHGLVDFLISQGVPAIATILFWIYKNATPGKMVIHAKIVDATIGNTPSTNQCISRYFAYIVPPFRWGRGFMDSL